MENHEETCIFSAGHHQMRYTGNDRSLFKRREYWPTSADAAFPLCPFCMEEEVRTGRYWYAENFTRFAKAILPKEVKDRASAPRQPASPCADAAGERF